MAYSEEVEGKLRVESVAIRMARWGGSVLIGVLAAIACGHLLLGSMFAQTERWLGVSLPTSSSKDGFAVAGEAIGGPFSLTNAMTGTTVTARSFPDRWRLMYFGYTFCPDVCPTDLQNIIAALNQMGSRGKVIVPIFVTVDPQRDTPAVLARYTALFSPRLVGLTGSQQAIHRVVSEFRVLVQRVPLDMQGGVYIINHSAFMYLINPQGTLSGIYPPNEQPQSLAAAWAKAVTAVGTAASS